MIERAFRFIELTQGRVAIVDEDDFESVNAFSWQAAIRSNVAYARRGYRDADGRYRSQYLHTFLTGWRRVDHINGDGLDNRRSNLREVTQAQNSMNAAAKKGSTSRYKGVYWAKVPQCWAVSIRVEGRRHWVGSFVDETEAAMAYDAAARRLAGGFAALNFPGPGESSAHERGAGLTRIPCPGGGSGPRRKRCVNGHEYTEQNLLTGKSKPKCRTCAAAHQRRWRAKKRQAAGVAS